MLSSVGTGVAVVVVILSRPRVGVFCCRRWVWQKMILFEDHFCVREFVWSVETVLVENI